MEEFDDIVTVRTRTDKQLSIMHDSRERFVDVKKGLKCPRAMAELGIKQHAFLWDQSSGAVKESLLYIEEDVDTSLALPHTKLDMNEVAQIKKTDGLGKGKAFIDGKFVPMKSLEIETEKPLSLKG